MRPHLFAALPLIAAIVTGHTVRPPSVAHRATAAGVRALQLGAVVTDSLTATDPTLDDGSHAHEYALPLREGERVVITLHATAMDAMLMIGLSVTSPADAAGPASASDVLQFTVLGRDVERDGETSTRVAFTAPMAGQYAVIVDGVHEASLGVYTLSASDASAITPAEARIGRPPGGPRPHVGRQAA